jgi:hypothetical protein
MRDRKYLVYQITNKINKMIYIGVHITRNINDGYMGSGRKITKAISEYGISNFEKVILYQFDNESDMIKKESELVNDSFLKRGDVYNIIIGGGFITKDLATVRDVDGNTFDVNVSDPRISSGELVGITKGNVTACDEFGNFFYIPVDDERYNKSLTSLIKLKMCVRNNILGKNEFIERDKFNVDIHSGLNKNMILSSNMSGDYFLAHRDDPRFVDGSIFPIWKGRRHSEDSKKKIGEKNSINQRGEKNSQHGTLWINREGKNIKIKKNDLNRYLIMGWVSGRVNVHKKNILS